MHLEACAEKKKKKVFLFWGNLTALCDWKLSKHGNGEEGKYMTKAVSELSSYAWN